MTEENVENSPTEVPTLPPVIVKGPRDLALEACEEARIALPDKSGNPPIVSSDPAYWAKASCSKCYGRGIIGKITSTYQTNKYTTDYVCGCSNNRWERWKNNFVKEWLKNNAP